MCREVWSAGFAVDLGGELIPAERVTKLVGRLADWRTKRTTAPPRSRALWLTRVVGAYRAIRLRVRVAVKRDELDRALANGVDPGRAPELALRAARLVRHRDRRALACCLRLVVEQADGAPWLTRVNPREIRRAEILADREALVSLIERLESAHPVHPEGAAIAERLIGDLSSPLFVPAEPGTIRRLARQAVAAMEPLCGPSCTVAGVRERAAAG